MGEAQRKDGKAGKGFEVAFMQVFGLIWLWMVARDVLWFYFYFLRGS